MSFQSYRAGIPKTCLIVWKNLFDPGVLAAKTPGEALSITSHDPYWDYHLPNFVYKREGCRFSAEVLVPTPWLYQKTMRGRKMA